MTSLLARTMPRALTAAAAIAAVLGSAAAATAASAEDRAAATQHLKQAQELRKQGQLAEACGHLQEVERLDPKLPALMDLADCTEQLGKLVEARTLWAAARDRARQTEKPQSRARAEERLAAVEARVSHLTLELHDAAEGTQVLRDGAAVDVGTLGSELAIDPGDHVIVVKLADHEDAKYELKLAEGERKTLAIAPGPAIVVAAPPPPPRPVAPPPKPVEVSSSGSGQRSIGLVVGATGLVAAGVGGALWFTGYPDSGGLGAPADQQVLAGEILVIGGGALLVTGAVLFATAPSSKASTRARLPLAPTVAIGPHGTLLGAAGRF